jgi:ABC-type transport system involved in multi-copper enzyme maturation permease subunit
MRASSTTLILLRDELIGFARSRVMLVMWGVLPLLAMAGYLLLPAGLSGGTFGGSWMSATLFMSFVMSNLAGTVAALMVAVDLVTERNRKVYELLVIRPIRRDAIVWAKFLAVLGCVALACLVSIGLGLALDAVRGQPPSAGELSVIVKALLSLVVVLALATAVGVLFGVLLRSLLVVVMLVLYIGQNVAIVPMLPMYLGVPASLFWLVLVAAAALALGLVYLAGRVFRRAEL